VAGTRDRLQTGAVAGSRDHSWKGIDVQIYFLKNSHKKRMKHGEPDNMFRLIKPSSVPCFLEH
jgi:hypothetical protein